MKIERKAWIGRYRVTFAYDSSAAPRECVRCDWSPAAPSSTLTRNERRLYLKARHKFIAAIAKELGGKVAVIDV